MTWQPIETAPKEGHFLITNGEIVVEASPEHNDPEGKYWDIMGYRWPAPFNELKITHWMPLPAPPQPERRTLQYDNRQYRY